jgi:hypothetical protein
MLDQSAIQKPTHHKSRITDDAARHRAWRWFTLAGLTCAECERAPAQHRHHWDGDIRNNAPENIVPVCRRCHARLHKR